MRLFAFRPAILTLYFASFGGFATDACADPLSAEQGAAILDELRQIRQLLERQVQTLPAARQAVPPAGERVRIRLAPGGYSIGRSDAPLTLVEYTDYQCPFCRQFHISAFEEIRKNYIDTGKLRYVTRDFPLDMHENAPRAAISARCADEQGKFWEMRHVMIVNANQLQKRDLIAYATDLKLDIDRFANCLDSGKYQTAVLGDLAEGRSAGVSGTPSFVLGPSDNESIDGVLIVGALPYAVFDAKLKTLLANPAPR